VQSERLENDEELFNALRRESSNEKLAIARKDLEKVARKLQE